MVAQPGCARCLVWLARKDSNLRSPDPESGDRFSRFSALREHETHRFLARILPSLVTCRKRGQVATSGSPDSSLRSAVACLTGVERTDAINIRIRIEGPEKAPLRGDCITPIWGWSGYDKFDGIHGQFSRGQGHLLDERLARRLYRDAGSSRSTGRSSTTSFSPGSTSERARSRQSSTAAGCMS
jgi:hypothetical protein